MSVTWFPRRDGDDDLCIDVPNPGYGELILDARSPLVEDESVITFNGPELGELLAVVTERATGPATAAPRRGNVPPWITPAIAREILPALQRAVLTAVAGEERLERVFRDEAEPPPRPLCSRCNEGTCFHPGAMPSKWCEEYGHQPFGFGAETRWETAQNRHEFAVKMWQSRRDWEAKFGPLVAKAVPSHGA